MKNEANQLWQDNQRWVLVEPRIDGTQIMNSADLQSL